MGFATPLALLGMLAVALPIIAHLLRRRDVPIRALPTIALLHRADVASRRKVRIVDRGLLALRIALVIAAVLGLAAPFFVTALAWGDGRLASVALVIDDSMSMGQRRGRDTALTVAVARAREIVDALPEGSEVALVLGGQPARLLLSRTGDRALARARLAELPAEGARGTDLRGSLELAGRQLSGARHPARQVIVLGDRARHAGLFEGGELEEARHALGADIGLEIPELFAGDPAPGNVAITDAVALPVPGGDGQSGQLSIAIEVRSFGDPRGRVPVLVRRAGREIGRGEVVLERGASEVAGVSGGRTTLRVPIPSGDDPTLEVALALDPPDALPIDDRRGLLLRAASAARVISVDGDPEPLRRRQSGSTNGVAFISQALALAPRREGGIVHRAIDRDTFATASLSDVDVLVLSGVSLADPVVRARVAEHYGRGGGLVIAPGEGGDGQPVRILEWPSNDGARSPIGALFPARASSVIEGERIGMVREPGSALLPPGPTGLESVRAVRRLALEARDGAEVALRWSDGIPAVVVSADERIVVLGTALGDTWSDLPLRPGYLPLLVALVRGVAPPGAMPDAALAPGQVPALRVPADAFAVELISPEGRVVTHRGGALGAPIDLSELSTPGAWRVRIETAGEPPQEAPRSAFVIAPPVSESDLSVAELGAQGEPGAAASSSEHAIVRRSIAPWLFLLVGLFAIGEGVMRARSPRQAG